MTSSEQWRYVATEDNPASFVSRGMDSLKLKTCELWWNGPKFLMSNQYPQRQIPVAVIKDPGRSVTSIVEPDLTNLNENRLDNWQKITKIIQLIWKRWSVDYLNSLQQRNKWHFEKKNAKIGDMVIVKENNLPSCQWSLGRINNIYPGKDSKVRVVEVKTTRGCEKIVTENLKYEKLCIRWVPRLLTAERKQKRFASSLDFLIRCKEGDGKMSQIVTGDETWVSHITPESKKQSMEW
ncbi:DUF5641 domain-containing protein [Trichonephila clavipes]|nr:DUF5641 domain-containing protein [Trichonephila clavipes]